MDADRPTLRALLWCFAAASPKAPTVGTVLDKDYGHCLRTVPRLKAPTVGAAKHHRNAEPVNMTLVEYLP